MPSGQYASSIAVIRERIAHVPRYPLGHFPTPLEKLTRLSQVLGGPTIWIKRDDCTGLALGGNKTRHNEFLIGDALDKQCDIVVWGAGVQSNNCRQTAAGCAKAGLDCHLMLSRGNDPTDPIPVQGNLLLDHLLGAVIEIVPDKLGLELDRRMAKQAEVYANQGRKPYVWSPPVVKHLAALSYVLCILEIVEQSTAAGFQPDAIYLSSAGSTGAGAALGKALLQHPAAVRNIAPLKWPWDTQADLAKVANRTAEILDVETRLTREDIDINFDFIAPGYGQVSPAGLEALALLARCEGILTDPIYTAKALAALISDIRAGRISPEQNIVFIHTGGTPALFAYNEELAQGIAART